MTHTLNGNSKWAYVLCYCQLLLPGKKGGNFQKDPPPSPRSISQYSLPYVCLIQTGSKDDKSWARKWTWSLAAQEIERPLFGAIWTEKFFHLMVDLILLWLPVLSVGADESYLMGVHVPVRWNESCCLLESEVLLMLYSGSPQWMLIINKYIWIFDCICMLPLWLMGVFLFSTFSVFCLCKVSNFSYLTHFSVHHIEFIHFRY